MRIEGEQDLRLVSVVIPSEHLRKLMLLAGVDNSVGTSYARVTLGDEFRRAVDEYIAARLSDPTLSDTAMAKLEYGAVAD
jgi:hypothetical protein